MMCLFGHARESRRFHVWMHVMVGRATYSTKGIRVCVHACATLPGRVAQSVGHLTRKSEVLGSIPGLATYFCFSFRFSKKGSCHLLAKVCARSTG